MTIGAVQGLCNVLNHGGDRLVDTYFLVGYSRSPAMASMAKSLANGLVGTGFTSQ